MSLCGAFKNEILKLAASPLGVTCAAHKASEKEKCSDSELLLHLKNTMSGLGFGPFKV